MEIGTKPIPISVLTAVTNSALNAASVFPSSRIEISDSYTDLNRSADAAWSAQPFDGDPKFCSRVYKPSPECGGITSEHCEFVGRRLIELPGAVGISRRTLRFVRDG
jgi:hypothetical protein